MKRKGTKDAKSVNLFAVPNSKKEQTNKVERLTSLFISTAKYDTG